MTRISEHFALGVSQPQLDFVDVDLATDTEVYVDPHAIRQLRTEWGQECAALIGAYFDSVLAAIRSGKTSRADALLRQLREPNQTRLGLSRGQPAGHALGTGLATRIRDKLQQSQALQTGLIEDLEDTILMVDLIGRDIISDITTNVIRQPLINYTQQACRDHGIPMQEGVFAGPIWDPEANEWHQGSATLPWVGRHALLLVPKVIVRRRMDFEPDDYFDHYIIPFLAGEELEAGSALVRLVKSTGELKVTRKDLIEKYGRGKSVNEAVTRAHPQLLASYRLEKAESAPPAISHTAFADLTGTPPPDWDALLAAVTSVTPGNVGATAFHRAVESLLTPLFYPWLTNPVREAEIHSGRKRIDIRYDNTASDGFFDWVGRRYIAPCIAVECKNYAGDPTNPELDQLAGRFSPRRGVVGILICRTFLDRVRFAERCHDTAVDGRGYVLALDDADLIVLVAARKAGDGAETLRLLRERFNGLMA